MLPLATQPSSVTPSEGRDGRRTRLWLTVAVVCGSAIYLFASASWAAVAGGGWTLVGGRREAREAASASSSPATVGIPQELPVGGNAVAAAATRPQELGGGGALVSDGSVPSAGSSAVSVGTLGFAGSTDGQGGPAADTASLVVASREAKGVRTDPVAVVAARGTITAASAVDNTSATATGGVVKEAAPSVGSAAATAWRRSLNDGNGSDGRDGPVAESVGQAPSATVGHLLAAATAEDGTHLGGVTVVSSAVGGDRDGTASAPGTAHLSAAGAVPNAAYSRRAPASIAAGAGENGIGPGGSGMAAMTTMGSRSTTESAELPTSSMATVIGAVYVLNAEPCTDKLAWVRERARAAVGLDVPLTILSAVAGQDVSLDAPPLPVARTRVPPDAAISGGQLAATVSHQAAWRRTVAEGHPVVVVLEDDTFPTDELLARLPALVRGLDLGAATEDTSWHVAYLSRHPLGAVAAEKTWSVAGAEGDASASVAAAVAGVSLLPPRRLTVAGRSWGGTAAYLLTATGARHLLDAVTTYTGPLDETLSDVPGLVVLSACDNDAPVHRCPENVVRAGVADMGGCAQPAAAVGERRLGRSFIELRGEELANTTTTTIERAIAAAAVVADAHNGGVAKEGVADAVRPAEGGDAAANEAKAAALGTSGSTAVLEGAVAQGDAVSPAGANNASAPVATTPAAPGAPAGPAITGSTNGAAAAGGGMTPSNRTAGLVAREDSAVTAEAATATVVAPDDDTAAILEGIAEGEAAALWGTALGDATAPNGAALAPDGAETVAAAPPPPAAIRAHAGGARFYIN